MGDDGRAGVADATRPDPYNSWGLGCFVPPANSAAQNNHLWGDDGFYTGPSEGDTDLTGKWNADHTVLDVQCNQSWPLGSSDNPTGSASYSATGDLHLISGP